MIHALRLNKFLVKLRVDCYCATESIDHWVCQRCTMMYSSLTVRIVLIATELGRTKSLCKQENQLAAKLTLNLDANG
jgi:hypothetical protein